MYTDITCTHECFMDLINESKKDILRRFSKHFISFYSKFNEFNNKRAQILYNIYISQNAKHTLKLGFGQRKRQDFA